MATKSNLFKDILKVTIPSTGEKKFSQGRVYLFLSVVAYYATLGIYTYKSLKPNSDIDVKTLDLIISALQYSLVLFGGYVFGGKFVDIFKVLKGENSDNSNGNTTTTPTTPNN